MRHENLIVIGTSHIAKDSVRKVTETITAEKPDIVAVELDHARLHALLSEQKPRFSLAALRVMGLTGFVFFTIGGLLQRKLGKLIGAVPGEEMKTAVKVANQIGARVALIDQPLSITMKNLSKIRFREKLRLVKDVIFGITGLETEKVNIDLSKTPTGSFVEMAMRKVRRRYPGLYKALVTDRDNYMAHALMRITKSEPDSKITAVVGAGHEKEIAKLIKTVITKQQQQI
ncbi:TraB/GumN family protein [Candidatus Woesearchaeota archaeon]|nr:TraB/GumN family protein [Candidatus Woesearchaeota archaeon]